MFPAKYIRIFRKLDSELSSETYKVIQNKVPLSSKQLYGYINYCEASGSSAASGMCLLHKTLEPWRWELYVVFLHPFLLDVVLRFPFYALLFKNLYRLCPATRDSQRMNVCWMIQWAWYSHKFLCELNSICVIHIKHIYASYSTLYCLVNNTRPDFFNLLKYLRRSGLFGVDFCASCLLAVYSKSSIFWVEEYVLSE